MSVQNYEKSVIDFANSNPDGWEQVKDKMRILYPTPTIWNSHCIASFDEAGDEYYDISIEKNKKYNYSNIYFNNFVKKSEKSS